MKTRTRKRARAGGKGSIFLIMLLFFGSVVIRVSSGAGEALAKGSAHETAAIAKEESEHPQPASGEEHASDSQKPEKAEKPVLDRVETAGLLKALQQREQRVKAREKQIEMRTKALSVADEEIQKRLVALENAELALRKTLALAQSAAEDDLARLTAVYENMKPKDAAAVFEAMEPDFAAGFLARMRPDAAAAVMTGLAPETAYSISVILAGRNAKVPKS